MTQRILSPGQVAQFHRDGFLTVRGMYGPGEIADIERWTRELAGSGEMPGRDW